MVNKIYVPLVPQLTPGPNSNVTSTVNSFVYRGYHEKAWIINRFAHVARKHGMLDASVTLLSKIYTLPNIEIQEAFVKLKEQAKCHYESGGNELSLGLDVISNANVCISLLLTDCKRIAHLFYEIAKSGFLCFEG